MIHYIVLLLAKVGYEVVVVIPVVGHAFAEEDGARRLLHDVGRISFLSLAGYYPRVLGPGQLCEEAYELALLSVRQPLHEPRDAQIVRGQYLVHE